MKTKISIFSMIVLILGIVLFIAHYQYGYFTPCNSFTANRDLQNGDTLIVGYGEPMPNQLMRNNIAEEFGFKMYGVGCLVSESLTNGIVQYNSIVYGALDKRNGKNWQKRYEERIKSQFEASLTNDSNTYDENIKKP